MLLASLESHLCLLKPIADAEFFVFKFSNLNYKRRLFLLCSLKELFLLIELALEVLDLGLRQL